MSVRQAVERASQAPATASPKEVIRGLLDSNKGAIGASLPSGMSADRFARLLLTAANTNPDLFSCDPRSFLAAGVMCAQLGLEPNDARGLAYLIPFNDRQRGKVVNLIIGYRGLMDLARRSGQVTSINAFPVFEGDRFEYSLGLDPTLEHVPNEDGDEDPATLTHVYAVAQLGGDRQFVVMTRKQVDRIRNSSPGAKTGRSPWTTHYVEMAKKTAIRRLCKYLPLTVEAARAVDTDERPLMLGDLGVIVDEGVGNDAPTDDRVHDDTDVVDVDEVPFDEPDAGDGGAAEPNGEAMTQAQSRALHALLRSKHGATGDARFPVLSGLLGRDVASTSELSKDEASQLIDALQDAPDHDADAEPALLDGVDA